MAFEGFAGAAVFDNERSGEIVAEGYLAYLRGNDDVVILPHPIEEECLKEAGGSWKSATLDGRILSFMNLLCTECGAINKTADVHASGLGCLTGIAASVLMIVANYWLIHAHWLIELGLVWVALFAPMIACDFFVRRRHADRANPFRFTQCHECGSRKAIPFANAMKRRLPCRRCGRPSVVITIAGKS